MATVKEENRINRLGGKNVLVDETSIMARALAIAIYLALYQTDQIIL